MELIMDVLHGLVLYLVGFRWKYTKMSSQHTIPMHQKYICIYCNEMLGDKNMKEEILQIRISQMKQAIAI